MRWLLLTTLGLRYTDYVIFSASRTFWPLLVVIDNAERWVQLPTFGFPLGFYSNHSCKRTVFEQMHYTVSHAPSQKRCVYSYAIAS